MNNLKSKFLLLSLLIVVSTIQISALGPPSSFFNFLGENIAGNIASDAILQTRNQMIRNDVNEDYKDALKKFEKRLIRLEKKHSKKRLREEQHLQRLIDDLNSYTPGDPDVNMKQEEKLQKIYEYAQIYQENDRIRADEVQQFCDENFPKTSWFLESF